MAHLLRTYCDDDPHGSISQEVESLVDNDEEHAEPDRYSYL